MKNLDALNERQKQFFTSTRPIDDPLCPTRGYYFVRGIREKEDNNGNKVLIASVNWKLNEDDTWQDFPENRFLIRLDYLFGKFSLKPSLKPTITPQELLHNVVVIKSILADKSKKEPLSPSDIYADWEVTDFSDIVDALPYFNLFNRYILANDDYQYELEELNQDAIDSDFAKDSANEYESEDDECDEYDEADSSNNDEHTTDN